MAKHLVLVGGGHAHMTVLANLKQILDQSHKVTVIAPSPYHYYSGMGPGLLGGTYHPEQVRFATQEMVSKQGGMFIQDKVVGIEPDKKILELVSGSQLTYDVVSFNTGSHVPANGFTNGHPNTFSVKPIEKLIQARTRVLELSQKRIIKICVVGGGPSAVEMAGNIWKIGQTLTKHPPLIQILSRNTILSQLPEKIRHMAKKSLEYRGIEIHESGSADRIDSEGVLLHSGERFPADVIFLALGIQPSPIFRNSGLPIGPDGGLKVNRYLQSPDYPDIFGGGDCIFFEACPLDKVGVYAVRQNPILFHNLLAALSGSALKSFDPGSNYLMILNLGDNTGILLKNRLQLKGRLAFILKDYIDRKFMRRFQSF